MLAPDENQTSTATSSGTPQYRASGRGLSPVEAATARVDLIRDPILLWRQEGLESTPGMASKFSGAAVSADADIIARLDIANQLRQPHYNSIWEQQKHFTWLISAVFSAEAIVFGTGLLNSHGKPIILCLVSGIGILFSLMGFRVQRIEGRYFCSANEVFAREYKAVFPYAEVPYRRQDPNKTVPGLFVAVLRDRAGVRDSFQFIFLALSAVFIAIAICGFILL